MSILFSMLALAMVLRSVDGAGRTPAVAEVLAAEARKIEQAAWRPGVIALAVIVLFLTLGTSLQTPMIGAYTRDVLQVKMSFLALLFPGPALLAGIALWKLGHLTDRCGRQVPLIAGLFVASLSIFALTLTTSPFIVVNLVVLAGLAYAVSIPAWGAAALDATDVGSRGLWLGALSAVQGLGVAGGQALGGVIGGVWGPLAPFKLAALLLMIALALIVSHQSMQRRKHRRLDDGDGMDGSALVIPAAVPAVAD